MKTPRKIGRILIIAGSDSGGGAGIQADIKTVTMLGGHAMTAITAITAQNTLGVQAVMPVPTDMVIAQIESCVSDIGVDAIKIGMLGSAETAHAVADVLERLSNTAPFPGEGRGPAVPADEFTGDARPSAASQLGPGVRWGTNKSGIPIVFDPVMVATSGDVLADDETVAAFERLMRSAAVTTPNPDELARLSGSADRTDLGTVDAASALAERFGTAVLATGTRMFGGRIYGTDKAGRPFDYPTDGRMFDRLFLHDAAAGFSQVDWDDSIIQTTSTHGTGCTLSSAIAFELGCGRALDFAIARARQFVRLAIHDAPGLGGGHGPMGQQAVRLDLGAELRLNQVTVGCADYAASCDFYRTIGLKQIVDSPDHYARFEAPGGATLSIEQGAAATLFLECSDLDVEVARLEAAGLAFEHRPVEQEWLWREARLRDPAGNMLCLYQAGENRRYPPWRLSDA